MKRIIFTIVIFSLSITLISCGGNKSNNSASEDASTKTEESVKKENKNLAEYETIINKMIKLYESDIIKSDNKAVMAEIAELTEELYAVSVELQKEVQSLTLEEMEKLTGLSKKLTEVATKTMQ